MGYVLIAGDAPGELHRIARPADDIVDAGCDDARCYAVALVRGAAEDGTSPEAVTVLAYP